MNAPAANMMAPRAAVAPAAAHPPAILWVTPSDPWSPWTFSGISRAICLELRRRGVLWGAVSPEPWSLRHRRGPGWSYKVERKFRRSGVVATMNAEDEAPLASVLRSMPAGAAVVYLFLTPRIDPTLPLRRFRLIDLSLPDAVRTGSYGFDRMDASEIARRMDEQRRSLEYCDGVLALSTYAADAIARDFGYPRQRITPVGAGAALNMSNVESGDADRYERGRILFVGRDWDRKGGPLLLDAFRRVRGELPGATLTIVGPKTPVAAGEGIEQVGPIDKSTPAGAKRLNDLLSRSSLFCMPSVCETWGLVYVEAAMAELPVVGFDDWAMPDIVEHDRTGLLVSERSPAALATAMTYLLRQPGRLRAMGRAARQRVADVLDWPHVVDRLLHRVLPAALAGREPRWMQAHDDRASRLEAVGA